MTRRLDDKQFACASQSTRPRRTTVYPTDAEPWMCSADRDPERGGGDPSRPTRDASVSEPMFYIGFSVRGTPTLGCPVRVRPMKPLWARYVID